MSVLVTLRVQGDTDQFRRFIASEDDRMRGIADDARARGAIHHRFGIGDGFVLVVDEWGSAEAFQQFFETNQEIPSVMRDAGAQGEPEVTIAEAVETADQF
jgi:heme-degrading monooxygenase HmoA